MKTLCIGIIILLTPLTAAVPACGGTAQRINDAACSALDPQNFIHQNGIVKLYGTRTNGPDTQNGKWACAKVVTIILREAGVLEKLSLGVRHVETALKDWQIITREDDLRPGDIIVWVNRFKGRKDRQCTGGGNCHVGVATDKGYFHNSPLGKAPVFGGISLWGFKFKTGYRPPD